MVLASQVGINGLGITDWHQWSWHHRLASMVLASQVGITGWHHKLASQVGINGLGITDWHQWFNQRGDHSTQGQENTGSNSEDTIHMAKY